MKIIHVCVKSTSTDICVWKQVSFFLYFRIVHVFGMLCVVSVEFVQLSVEGKNQNKQNIANMELEEWVRKIRISFSSWAVPCHCTPSNPGPQFSHSSLHHILKFLVFPCILVDLMLHDVFILNIISQYMFPWLVWSSLCGPGWPPTHRDLPASASQEVGFKVCTTTPSFKPKSLMSKKTEIWPIKK